MGTKRHLTRLPERRITPETASVFDDERLANTRLDITEQGTTKIPTDAVMPCAHEYIEPGTTTARSLREVADYLGGTLHI